jgi:hypothetical protein
MGTTVWALFEKKPNFKNKKNAARKSWPQIGNEPLTRN